MIISIVVLERSHRAGWHRHSKWDAIVVTYRLCTNWHDSGISGNLQMSFRWLLMVFKANKAIESLKAESCGRQLSGTIALFTHFSLFFLFVLLFNPHSFIMTSYVLIYSYFSSLTACLYVQYSAR